MTSTNRMIHKKKNAIRETFTTKFKKGSLWWGIGIVLLLCLVFTTLSHWGLDKLSLGATWAVRFFWREKPMPVIANVTTSTSPGPADKPS